MKKLILLSVLLQGVVIHETFPQGWTAQVMIDLNHNLYAYEKISSASFTYSGVTATGSSETNSLQFTLLGSGTITGQITATVNGFAYEPQGNNLPYSVPLAITCTRTFTPLCTNGFFEQIGQTSNEQMHVWITVYPRMVISEFSNNCDHLSLSTSTCSSSFLWEVSGSVFGPYKLIPGKSTPSITVSREDLNALGFADPYGRKYFRVTGYAGTTSEIQAMDVYYPPPTATARSAPPKCADGADGSIAINITSANPAIINDFVVTLFSDAALQNSKGQNPVNDNFTTVFTDLAAGSYWIKIENNSSIGTYGNCAAVYPVAPMVNPKPVIIMGVDVSDFNGFNVSCDGSSDGTMRITPSGGTGVYSTYEWASEVSTTAFAEHLNEGTYQVRVKDSNGCWSENTSRTLLAPDPLAINLSSSGGKNGFDVSCLDKSDGNIEGQISGGVGTYTYNWSTGSQNPTLANIGPGSYTLAVTDANTCRASSTITLSAPAAIDFEIAEISGITCPNDDSGALEIQSTRNTIGEIYYAWSSGESTNDVRNKSSGTYTASVSDEQGCSATRAYTLAEPVPWSIDLRTASDYNGTPIRCHGEDDGVLEMIVRNSEDDPVQADNYSWYRNGEEWLSGPGYSSVDGLTAGNYKGVITYNISCTLEETITLNEPESLRAEISNAATYNGMAISCAGASDGALRATGAGGTGNSYTYQWNDGTSGRELSQIGAGTYTVIVRDVNGCEASAEKIVEEPAPVRASIAVLSDFNGQAISCTGATDARLRASAYGGTNVFSYLWNTGETDATLADVSAGTYEVKATDLNGCEALADTIILEPEPLKAWISDQSDYNGFGVACNGNQDGFLLCDASGGTGAYLFEWNGKHTQPLYENLASGNYSVIVTDQNGCAASTQATLTAPTPISLMVTGTQSVRCFGGSDGELKVAASGGAGGYVYAVDNQQAQIQPSFFELKAGNHVIAVSDVNHCMVLVSQPLAEPTELAISIDQITDAACGKATGAIVASVSGGTEPYAYQWTNSENLQLYQGPDISAISSGVYRLNVSDGNQCEAARTVGVTSQDGPQVSVAKIVPASCSYSQDGSAEVTVNAGHGPFTFLWEDGQSAEKAINLKKGGHFVEVTDSNECTATKEVTIPAPDSLQVRLIGKTEPICHGDCNGRLLVAASGGDGAYNFHWDAFNGAELVDLCAGTYRVTVTDGNQCASTSALTLNEPKPVSLVLKQSRDPVCHDGCDGQLQVLASGGTGSLHYQWSTGGIDSVAASLCPGSYTVTVSDDNSCTSRDTYVLKNAPGESLNLGGSITLCSGQEYTLDAGPQWREYAWSANNGFNSSSRRVTIAEPGMYWLTATSNKGCTAQDTFLLETSNHLLQANFLMTTEATAMDTVVIIDISWPLPETTTWKFPEEMKRLQDFADIVFGQFQEPGNYDVTLAATLGECRDEITKTVTILRGKESSGEGRLGAEPFVKAFDLYPNPNEGTFDVAVEYREPAPLTLTVWNILTARKIGQITDDGKEVYHKRFELKPLPAGPYSIRLDDGRGTQYIRFIVR